MTGAVPPCELCGDVYPVERFRLYAADVGSSTLLAAMHAQRAIGFDNGWWNVCENCRDDAQAAGDLEDPASVVALYLTLCDAVRLLDFHFAIARRGGRHPSCTVEDGSAMTDRLRATLAKVRRA